MSKGTDYSSKVHEYTHTKNSKTMLIVTIVGVLLSFTTMVVFASMRFAKVETTVSKNKEQSDEKFTAVERTNDKMEAKIDKVLDLVIEIKDNQPRRRRNNEK